MNKQFNQKKQIAGLIYGLIAGLAFAFFAWGVDAVELARAHAMYSWIKFLPALVICLPVSALVGWITMRTEDHLLGVALWALMAMLFAWLVLWLPLKNTPQFIKLLDGQLTSFMNYPRLDKEGQFIMIAFAVTGLVSIIAGLLEINLVSQAMLSSATMAFISPLLLCVVMFGVAGSGVDSLLNSSLREPVVAVDDLIQFAVDHRGQEVDPILARQKHLRAVDRLTELLPRPRRLLLVSYDKNMGSMHVLVDFDGLWADCTTIFNQPVDCSRLRNLPGEVDYRYTDQLQNLVLTP